MHCCLRPESYPDAIDQVFPSPPWATLCARVCLASPRRMRAAGPAVPLGTPSGTARLPVSMRATVRGTVRAKLAGRGAALLFRSQHVLSAYSFRTQASCRGAARARVRTARPPRRRAILARWAGASGLSCIAIMQAHGTPRSHMRAMGGVV